MCVLTDPLPGCEYILLVCRSEYPSGCEKEHYNYMGFSFCFQFFFLFVSFYLDIILQACGVILLFV